MRIWKILFLSQVVIYCLSLSIVLHTLTHTYTQKHIPIHSFSFWAYLFLSHVLVSHSQNLRLYLFLTLCFSLLLFLSMSLFLSQTLYHSLFLPLFLFCSISQQPRFSFECSHTILPLSILHTHSLKSSSPSLHFSIEFNLILSLSLSLSQYHSCHSFHSFHTDPPKYFPFSYSSFLSFFLLSLIKFARVGARMTIKKRLRIPDFFSSSRKRRKRNFLVEPSQVIYCPRWLLATKWQDLTHFLQQPKTYDWTPTIIINFQNLFHFCTSF